MKFTHFQTQFFIYRKSVNVVFVSCVSSTQVPIVLIGRKLPKHPSDTPSSTIFWTNILSKWTKNELGTWYIYQHLNQVLSDLAAKRGLNDLSCLTREIHVWPDLHGNRSPIADPTLRGMICGLDMTRGVESLAITYLAFTQALAYGTRHIIDSLYQHKRPAFHTLLFCGGLAKNQLYVQCHADICNLPALIPNEQEMVLVGAAALGAAASGYFSSLEEASKAMGGTGRLLKPNANTVEFHNRKYKVFLKMLEDQRQYRTLMDLNSTTL